MDGWRKGERGREESWIFHVSVCAQILSHERIGPRTGLNIPSLSFSPPPPPLSLLSLLPSLPTQYLSNADERLKWQANALPTDDLCTENAIMIKRFNRYPLVVDPSGQATEFIMNEYRDRKITRTRLEMYPLCVSIQCTHTRVHVHVCVPDMFIYCTHIYM